MQPPWQEINAVMLIPKLSADPQPLGSICVSSLWTDAEQSPGAAQSLSGPCCSLWEQLTGTGPGYRLEFTLVKFHSWLLHLPGYIFTDAVQIMYISIISHPTINQTDLSMDSGRKHQGEPANQDINPEPSSNQKLISV